VNEADTYPKCAACGCDGVRYGPFLACPHCDCHCSRVVLGGQVVEMDVPTGVVVTGSARCPLCLIADQSNGVGPTKSFGYIPPANEV
jgi:hypothetical protein